VSSSGCRPASSPVLVWGLVGCFGMVGPQQAQLTDASRREAERRATVPRAERVLTNADLDRGRPSPSVTLESAGESKEPSPGPGDMHDAPRTRATAPSAIATLDQTPRGLEEAQTAGLNAVGRATAGNVEPSVRDEAWWRQRAEALSARRRRLGEQQRAMQNRIDMLAADIAERDDPFQRAALEGDRGRALEELDALGRDAADLERMAMAFEESARRQAVPAVWIRVEPD